MARRSRDRDLDALYARVPDSGCRGLCQEACGPIEMTRRERERLAEWGFDVPSGAEGIRRLLESGGSYRCPVLDPEGRCSAYDIRPMICRLYAAVDTPVLRCPYGCAPDEPMPDAEAREIIRFVEAIGGTSL